VRRWFCCCAVLAVLALPIRADEANETVIQVTVSPMRAPKPALRYTLLPELKEMNPGNPIPNYLKILVDQEQSSQTESFSPAALRLADWAARLDSPDWEILPKLKTDGVGLLIPDVQKLRSLATGFQERFRSEVAQGRVEDGLRTAKSMFALARHLRTHPTLIGGLVGIAIAFVTIDPLEQLIQQPNCPNLYWALTNLPRPFISLDKGMEGERLLIQSEFKELDYHTPMTPAQIAKLVRHIDLLLAMENRPHSTTRQWLDKHTQDKAQVQAARARLVDFGLAEEQVARFPADQVILLDDVRGYETYRDDFMKLMNLPDWELDRLAVQIKRPKEPPLFDAFVPAILKVRHAQGRLEQRIALLRHVEALRLYAADHAGKLPAKLADVPVPLPHDPFTGKPFRYRLAGETAHLYGTPPRGEEKNAGYNIHYEITIRK